MLMYCDIMTSTTATTLLCSDFTLINFSCMCSCYNKHHVIRYKGFSCILTFISLSLTHRAWGGGGGEGGGGIIQEQDEDVDCTFIQRGQVPTFKGANDHPLI